MGSKTGFHSGEAHAERMKCGDIYINERQFIPAGDLDTTYVSGTAATSYDFASERAQGMEVYAFTKAVNDQVSFKFVTPSNLKSDTKVDLRAYWTKEKSETAGTVTWEAQWWVTSLLVSGVEVVGKNYAISGVAAADGLATTMTEYVQNSSLMSGVITQTVVSIPASDISPNDFVKVQFSRDGEGTLDEDSMLIGILLEYVDG